jgi:hypothetical protein
MKYITDRRIAMVDNPEFPSFSSQKTQDGLNPEPDKVQQQNDTSTAPDSDDHTQQPFFSKPPETGIRPPAPPSAPPPPPVYPPYGQGNTQGNIPYSQPYNQPRYTPPAYPQNNYPQQQPYNYYPPHQPYTPVNKPASGLAIASLVLGIIALFLFWIPVINFITALLSLIFGIVSKSKGDGGLAIAGIVLGVITLIIICLSFLFLMLIPIMFASGSYEGYSEFGYESLNTLASMSSMFLKIGR